MATYGDVKFDAVVNENVVDSVEATDHNVEEGADITDHVRDNPSTIALTGVFTREHSAKKLSQLKKYMKNKELHRYTGRNIYGNMVILSIDRNHNADNALGFAFDITLREMRIATSKRVNIEVKHPKPKTNKKGKKDSQKTANEKARTKTKKVTKKGKQQPKRKPKGSNASGTRTPQRVVGLFGEAG